MENVVINVQNVEKSFKVYLDKGTTIKERALSRGRTKYEERKVLRGVSFQVKKGEAIGLIGKNGCGKSTTLKLLTKIIYPNKGTIEMIGRVSSLLELGAGFHPDMSGRENIYMNAAVFGLSHKEIDKRLDDIIAFSELENFIDNPVRTYSSGMYMRLAFSVAINVDADILLIDEILAVGDISFQKKCFDRLKDIKEKGTTIVIVSHSFDQIEKICDRSIWIRDGFVEEEGIPEEVHKHYLEVMEQERIARLSEEERQAEEAAKVAKAAEEEAALKRAEEEAARSAQAEAAKIAAAIEAAKMEAKEEALAEVASRAASEEAAKAAAELEALKNEKEEKKARIDIISKNPNLLEGLQADVVRRGNQLVELTRVNIVNDANEQSLTFQTGENMTVLIGFEAKAADKRGTITVGIHTEAGVRVLGTNTFIETQKIMDLSAGKALMVTFLDLPLLPGKYRMTVGMHDDITAAYYDQVDQAFEFSVTNLKGEQGICRIHSEWGYVKKDNEIV